MVIFRQPSPQLTKFDRVLESAFQDKLIDPIPFIHVAGYLRNQNSINQLVEFVVQGSETQKYAAIFALLRMGLPQVVDYTMSKVDPKLLPLPSLATGAPGSFFTTILNVLQNKDGQNKSGQNSWTENIINCLAIGGVADFIPVLIRLLEQDDLADFAAKGLFTITGARLTETTFEEDVWVEDELFAEEVEAFKQGIMPQRTDDRPYGEEVEKLSSDPQIWREWWQQNQPKFVKGKRYRFGMKISPVSLVRSLHYAHADHALRELTYQELVIRYKADIHFSTMDFIRVQQQSLRELYQWAEIAGAKFTQGDWYFSGSAQ